MTPDFETERGAARKALVPMLRVGTAFVPLRGVPKLNPGSYFRPVR